MGYIVARTFGTVSYGTVLGLMTAALALGSTAGSLLLSQTIKIGGGYGLFLWMSGTIALAGSVLFILLPDTARQPEDDGRERTHDHGDRSASRAASS